MKKSRSAVQQNPNLIRNKAVRIFWSCVLGILAFTTVYPLFFLFVNSFKTTVQLQTGDVFWFPREWYFGNYYDAIVNRGILKYFANSVLYTLGTVALTLMVSCMLSFALTRMQWRGREKAMPLVILGIIFPSQIVVTPVFMLLRKLHLVDTPLAVILVISAFSLGISTLIATSFMRSIPSEMEEAAVIDGCGVWGIFLRIMLPIMRSPLACMSVFIFLQSWNEMIYSLVIINTDALKTLPLALLGYTLSTRTDYGGLFAAMAITSIVPILIYVFFSEQVEKAFSAGESMK